MMKAKRNYKEDVKKATAEKAEQKMVDSYKKDMAKAKDDAQFKSQVQEFTVFLTKSLEKKHNDFFQSMHDKLDAGVTLSENMVAALRKCMEREKQWAKEREEKKNAPAVEKKITLKIKPFLMKSLGIDSRIITGVVKGESKKAWLIEGHADMLVDMSFCARCGRALTEPASQVTGFGAICADKIGIPYDSEGVLSMSKKERAAIRKQFQKKLHDQKFECWIPKSQAEVFEG